MSLFGSLSDVATNVVTSVLDGNSSLWDGLNRHLIATFYEVEDPENNQNWQKKQDSAVVQAPVIDGSFESTQTWQSPFENAGPEQKAPALTGMLQSGQLQGVTASLLEMAKGKQEQDSKLMQNMNNFKGRSGMTRLNSTQIYMGAPGVNIPLTLLLRAWKDADSEVEAPLKQLEEWTLPIKLDDNPSVITRALDAARGDREAIDVLMPSLAPCIIGVTFKGRSYFPLVIESFNYDLASPINSSGSFVSMKVQLTLSTLTSWDRSDSRRSRSTMFGTTVKKNTTGTWI